MQAKATRPKELNEDEFGGEPAPEFWGQCTERQFDSVFRVPRRSFWEELVTVTFGNGCQTHVDIGGPIFA